jgi:hypothetical protein
VAQHKEQQGFLTLAINSSEVNYLELAYLQALNVKATQTHNSYAVIVDRLTEELIEERHRRVFDYIIPVNYDAVNPFSIEVSVFNSTPFKETIKLESDLLFTRSIDHWWTAFRLKDVCLSTGALTYLSLPGTVRKYRQLFDDNNLPDVYNGLMYFRYSQTAADFFRAAAMIFDHWDEVTCNFKQMDQEPTTDVVYAIASLMMGKEAVTMPSMDFLNFVHMKSGFNGWSDTRSWLETVMSEHDGDIIRINNTNQYQPVHYYDKTYATQELIEYYESRVLG